MKSTFNINAVIVFVAVSIMYSCNNHTPGNLLHENKHRGDIIAQTFKTGDGWGYNVFVNDKLFIKQSIIPAIEGNKSFAKEEDAIKVATLVVNKIKQHEIPAIRLDELQQCGIVRR
ncbi:MAG: DUF4907 domain-containing protein [Ferruginibacter sp.]